jgi:hypothetical protein
MKKINYKKIFNLLDDWVSKNANGKYYPDNFIEEKEDELILGEGYGIQQNRREIVDFVKKIKKKNICLEIGTGQVGSTHFLFRQIFKKTITIELDKERIFNFRDRLYNYYNKHVLSDKRSHFIFGSSSSTETIHKLVKFLKKKEIDLLFVDGSHYFKDVLADWLIYKNFVCKGGIIAFHDCNNHVNNYGGVPMLIDYLNKKIRFKKIVHSKNMGIAYYTV